MEIIEAACESAQTGRNEKVRAVHVQPQTALKKTPGHQTAAPIPRA
jgi:ribosomal protein L21